MGYRILLVDDEEDILEFVKYNLSKEGYEVFTARNGREGLDVARRTHPHLILLDMMMPVMDGGQTCREIRRDPVLAHTMVVFLSALNDDEKQLSGFDVGADDYIVKPVKMQLLKSRVKAILSRVDENASPAPCEGGIEVDAVRHVVKCNGHVVELPRKEFALLSLLHSAPHRLFSREEIYREVWGEGIVVGDRTIDVHIRKLRQKIGENHIATVKGVGYKFVP